MTKPYKFSDKAAPADDQEDWVLMYAFHLAEVEAEELRMDQIDTLWPDGDDAEGEAVPSTIHGPVER